VYGVAKRARKYYLALTTATQDVQDFLSTDYGKAVLSNSSIQMLLKQSPTEIDLVADLFYLTAGEKQLLLSANVGEGLFFAGQSHVAMQIIAAPFEHKMITSNPEEKEKIKQEEEEERKEAEKEAQEKIDAAEVKPVELPDPTPQGVKEPEIILD
ncbi:MAG TPA: hypothetical protein VES68_03500, partial [Candidatus Sulfotelmatobacter sp.]|nr:hypothetical protein [Candidatus Sulfotelmatobacter sp.]